MTPGVRRGMLAAGLAITLLAAWWPVEDEPTDRAVTKKPPVVAGSSPAAAPVADEKPMGVPGANLFPRQSWAPPPPPPAAAAPPQAPPLPFAFGGRYIEGGQVAVFLKEGDRVHTARAGDTINENYRVESIEKHAVNIRYLPLQALQSLPIAEIGP